MTVMVSLIIAVVLAIIAIRNYSPGWPVMLKGSYQRRVELSEKLRDPVRFVWVHKLMNIEVVETYPRPKLMLITCEGGPSCPACKQLKDDVPMMPFSGKSE